MITVLRKLSLALLLAAAIAACNSAAPAEDLSVEIPHSVDSKEAGPSIAEATEAAAMECPELDPHPIAAAIAEDFEAAYEDVIDWFCDGHPFEDILLALQTERLASVGVAHLLEERARSKSWEAIWEELGITTR